MGPEIFIGATRPADPILARRLVVFAALALAQIAIISFLFYFPTGIVEWANPVSYAKKSAQFAVLAVAAFVLAAQPRRVEVFGAWAYAVQKEKLLPPILRNLTVFASLAVATIVFSHHVAAVAYPPWGWFAAYCCLLVANAVSLALVAAPLSFWKIFPRLAPVEFALSIAAAAFVLLAGELSRSSWASLSSATLGVSAWLLSIYESNVLVDMTGRVLGVGNFQVVITPECSGYEGIGLIVGFLSLYFWIFRSALKFPNVLLLVPIGIGSIWFLNAVRIAILVSIGAHLSPAIATDGFHSQAGWIAFVCVSLGLIAVAHRSSYFRRNIPPPNAGTGPDNRLLYALLLPFIALMASSIVASAFAPNDHPVYGLRVVITGAVLWHFRDVYYQLLAGVALLPILVGLAVGMLWIATDPLVGQPTSLGDWLQTLHFGAAAIWLAVRAFGSIVVVPMAEELAFRGYLYRVLTSRRIEIAPQAQFSWLAFAGSTVLFGLIHQRWLAAMLAGAVYAMLLHRSGKLGDAVTAHMASNAAIMFWAVTAGQWSLL